MLKRVREYLINDDELDSGSQRFLSLIFLFIAGAMCFFTYTREILGFYHRSFHFRPGFISAMIGLILVTPLYLRNILKWNKSVYTITSFTLILLVFASFVQLANGGNSLSYGIVFYLIAASIILSWLGIRGVAGISWILVIAAAVYSIRHSNIELGFCGFIYVLSGFLGLLMHTGLNPGALMKSLKDEYSKPIIDTANIAKSEIETTGVIAKTLT